MRTDADIKARITESAAAGAFSELRRFLALSDRDALARSWPGLAAWHKLIAFKLIDAAMAMEIYGRLPFSEKYLLFSGFPINSIAPALEGLPAAVRRLFVQLPADFQDRMFRQLTAGRSGRAG
ncbi:MAG: hypothetical protein WC881_10580 [Elusimicrobiota bacterium]|jgi:hypothetical protein